MQGLELSNGRSTSDMTLFEDANALLHLAPQAQGWCSWCCRWQYHQLIEECILTRDVYECQGCFRRTLPCRFACGAFSRGFDLWDEEKCAACQGRVGGAASAAVCPILVTFVSGERLVRGLPYHSGALAGAMLMVHTAQPSLHPRGAFFRTAAS